MDKYPKSLIIIVGILFGLTLVGSYFLYNQKKSKPGQTTPQQRDLELTASQTTANEEFPENPQKGDLGYQETQTKIEIGTQGVTKGAFEKVEDGNIFLRDGDALTQLPLTLDEVAVNCTTQDLSSATEIDFNQVSEVKVTTATELGNLIPTNENVVVFAQNVDGVNRAHTIAMDVSKCSQQ